LVGDKAFCIPELAYAQASDAHPAESIEITGVLHHVTYMNIMHTICILNAQISVAIQVEQV